VEFWVTVTRPREANGLGLGTAAARAAVDELLQSYQVLPDPEDLLVQWLGVCQRLSVIGRQAYDARLVALMQAHGIEQLVTLNPVDFRRYGISLITPTAT
jgi:predicted nucleic acid-binding protein